LLPAGRVKNALLRRAGHRIHPTAQARSSIVWRVGSFEMAAGASFGSANVVKNMREIRLGQSAMIGRWNLVSSHPLFVRHLPHGGSLVLGPHAKVTSRHQLDCSGSVSLGAFASLAGHQSRVMSHSVDLARNAQAAFPVVIGERSFVGTRVLILGGATLPDRSVLGAGSVLTRSRPDPEPGLWAGGAGPPARRGRGSVVRSRRNLDPRPLGRRDRHDREDPMTERRRVRRVAAARRAPRGGGPAWWRQDWGGMPVWGVALAAVAVAGLVVTGVVLRPTTQDVPSSPVALFLGDSYTAGTGASDKALGWANLVGEAEGWRVRNLARGGTGFASAITGDGAPAACGRTECPAFGQMALEGASLVPDIVVISGGRNDIGPDPVEADVDAFFDTIASTYPGSRIYVTDVLWHESEPAAVDRLSAVVHRDADRIGATWLDIGQPLAAGGGLLAADGVHPNDAGHEAIAQAVIAALG
ncbi:MAG: GDSL-type esterase/lipase family protein, partial [Microbacterium arborescens]